MLCTLRPAKVHLKSSDVHVCYECENSLGEAVNRFARVDLDSEGREKRILLELEKLQIRDEAKRRHADGEEDDDEYWPEPVDLTPYLQDQVAETVPTIGALRDDGQPLLYEAKWHTLIAPTTAGKSWFAAWQAKAVLESGGAVAYAHFEDAKAKTTVNRLRQLGVEEDAINQGFFWAPLERPLKRKSMGRFLQCCTDQPFTDGVRLLILDGIKAACTRHGWDVWLPSGVGAYAETLVYPATALGTTVLSLGHPVKDVKRANERHG
jgi:hypothetical protein